jgi:transcription antitermination factor NusG
MNGTQFISTECPIPMSAVVARAVGSWYAVQTRPRHEKKIAAGMQQKGINTFLPLVPEAHRWSDRQKLVHTPLFPHYVFVRIEDSPIVRVSVLRTNGVIKFVGGLNAGIPIPDEQIESIRTIVSNGTSFYEHPYVEIGRRIRIRGGSLDGVQGILVAKNEDLSLVVSLEILQRSLAVRVDGYQIESA